MIKDARTSLTWLYMLKSNSTAPSWNVKPGVRCRLVNSKRQGPCDTTSFSTFARGCQKIPQVCFFCSALTVAWSFIHSLVSLISWIITNQTCHVLDKKGPQAQLPTGVWKALSPRQAPCLRRDTAHGGRGRRRPDPENRSRMPQGHQNIEFNRTIPGNTS